MRGWGAVLTAINFMDVPIERYQPGGDIYNKLAAQYGTAAAQQVYQAALSNDRVAITDAIANVRSGPPLQDSTAAIFFDQLATDPLAAPLADVNKVIGNTAFSFLKNPWVLVAIGAGVFIWLGGGDLLKKWFRKLL